MKHCTEQKLMIFLVFFFLAYHGAATETSVFLDVFEIAGNLKSCQKDAKLVKLVLTRTV